MPSQHASSQEASRLYINQGDLFLDRHAFRMPSNEKTFIILKGKIIYNISVHRQIWVYMAGQI
jgi:hypothetical protein